MRTVEAKLQHLGIQLAADKLATAVEGILIKDEWEQGFLTRVLEKVDTRGAGSLSDKELKQIHRIYDQYFEA